MFVRLLPTSFCFNEIGKPKCTALVDSSLHANIQGSLWRFFGIEDYLRPSELIGLDITVRRIATGRSIALRCCY